MSKPTPIPELLQQMREQSNKKECDEVKKIERATEYFRKMFAAHNAIKYMKESIDRLYTSASYISPSFDCIPKSQSDPKRLESTIIKIADLKKDCEKLLNERTDFDKFVFSLKEAERNVLIMRCDKNMSWKEIAAALNISSSSTERIYHKVCSLANEQMKFIETFDKK